jgi:hypothetical protein
LKALPRGSRTCATWTWTEGEKTKIAEIRNEFRPKIVQALEGLRGTPTPEDAKVREDALKAGKPSADDCPGRDRGGRDSAQGMTPGKLDEAAN